MMVSRHPGVPCGSMFAHIFGCKFGYHGPPGAGLLYPFLYFWILWRVLWASGGCFEVVLPHFQKIIYFSNEVEWFSNIKRTAWSRTEVLKLKELQNDGFETLRGVLWLGIGTFFGSKLEYHEAPGPGPKS